MGKFLEWPWIVWCEWREGRYVSPRRLIDRLSVLELRLEARNSENRRLNEALAQSIENAQLWEDAERTSTRLYELRSDEFHLERKSHAITKGKLTKAKRRADDLQCEMAAKTDALEAIRIARSKTEAIDIAERVL